MKSSTCSSTSSLTSWSLVGDFSAHSTFSVYFMGKSNVDFPVRFSCTVEKSGKVLETQHVVVLCPIRQWIIAITHLRLMKSNNTGPGRGSLIFRDGFERSNEWTVSRLMNFLIELGAFRWCWEYIKWRRGQRVVERRGEKEKRKENGWCSASMNNALVCCQ